MEDDEASSQCEAELQMTHHVVPVAMVVDVVGSGLVWLVVVCCG